MAGPCPHCVAHHRVVSLVLVATSLGSQHSFPQVPPSRAPAATNHRSLCSFHWVASGWAHKQQLTLACTGGPPEPLPLEASFRTHQGSTSPAPQMTNPECRPGWHQSLPQTHLAPRGQVLHNSLSSAVMAGPHSQPENQSPSDTPIAITTTTIGGGQRHSFKSSWTSILSANRIYSLVCLFTLS